MDASKTPDEMSSLLKRLFPICRSLTGNGVRETFSILSEYIPLTTEEVSSGTQAFDWTVPKEWNISDAYVKNSADKKVIDFAESNLHVVHYSTPVREAMSLKELKKHIHTLPETPDIIPYRTSYYTPAWGFCMRHTDFEKLADDTYEVVIDSTLQDGSLTYGELFIPGTSTDEIVLSTYICHPSLANDNLSGPVLLTFLAQSLLEKKSSLQYSYRFLFLPETIGSLVWLSRNQSRVDRIKHGLVVTCVGDDAPFTYKKSRIGNAAIDRIALRILRESGAPFSSLDFYPLGSDERQYCSPAFNLPFGSLMRTPYQKYPEYHTSADNLDLVSGKTIFETAEIYEKILTTLEHERPLTYCTVLGFGEPQLGKRGLYAAIGGSAHDDKTIQQSMMWILNLSDGTYSLQDISERTGISLSILIEAARTLQDHKLLTSIDAAR